MKMATFIKNPETVLQLKSAGTDNRHNNFVIEKVVEIPPAEYQAFLFNLNADRASIDLHTELMHIDSSGIYHCLLVTISGAVEGVLIAKESYINTRYAAFWNYRNIG